MDYVEEEILTIVNDEDLIEEMVGPAKVPS
jgi:Mg2+/Co2+ transporter CorB